MKTPQELTEPLDNLSAEEAMKCVKVFESLPYSPADFELVKEIASKISEHARLGFGEMHYTCATKYDYETLPVRVQETLRNKGFRVHERWDAYVNAYYVIQWNPELSDPPVGEAAGSFSLITEAIEYRDAQWKAQKARKQGEQAARIEEQEAMREEMRWFTSVPSVPPTPKLGCLPLLIAAPATLILFFL